MFRSLLLFSALGYGAATNWVEHKDPKGFTIKHPPGWVVESPQKDMVVVHDSTGAVQAIAYGFMTRPEVSSRQWIEQQFASRFADRFPGGRLEQVAQRGKTQSTGTLKYSSPRFGDGRASVLCAISGGAGMMFAIATPAFRFDEFKKDLVGILQTFVVTGPPGAAPPRSNAGPGVEWVRWTDPAEHAYSMEVPKGWKVEGGIFRRSAIDVHATNRITSPDGQTSLFTGDRDLPGMFQEPNQINTTYRTPGQAIMRYQPGHIFAEGYAHKIGGAIRVKDKKPLEAWNKAAAQRNAPMNNAISRTLETYGDISFTSGNKAGYVIAGTTVSTVSGTGLVTWYVTYLAGFLCPPDQAARTMQILSHVLQSNQVSEAWFYGQQNTTAAVSKITAETAEYTSRLQSESYWNRQASQDRSNRNFDDYIRGVQRVTDPATGREYEAVAGSNYYYRDPGSGNVVGSDTPAIDVTALIPVK